MLSDLDKENLGLLKATLQANGNSPLQIPGYQSKLLPGQ